MNKQVKDLKPGDNLYFLDTGRIFVSVNKVISIEKYDIGDPEDEYLKVTWEKGETDYSPYPNSCIVKDTDNSFYEEPDYDSEDYDDEDYDEDEEREIFVNKEDVISRIKREISRLEKVIEEL